MWRAGGAQPAGLGRRGAYDGCGFCDAAIFGWVVCGGGGVLVLLLGSACRGAAADQGLAGGVDPFVDSYKSRYSHLPSARRPFGMVKLSLDTATERSWDSGDLYDKMQVCCFSQLHGGQLAGIPSTPATGENQGSTDARGPIEDA